MTGVQTCALPIYIEGAVWSIRGEYDTARALYTRMLSLASTQATRAKALQNLDTVAAEERDFEEGERLFAESREAYRAAGDARGEANSLLNIGRLQLDRGFADLASHTRRRRGHGPPDGRSRNARGGDAQSRHGA